MVEFVRELEAQGLLRVVDAGVVLSVPLQRLAKLMSRLGGLRGESFKPLRGGNELLAACAMALLELSLELKYVGLLAILQLF